MIGGIIVTHAGFAKGIKEALEMITGKQEALEAVGLEEGDGLETLMTKLTAIQAAMACEHVYLFVDLFGATPCNASSVLCAQGDCDVIAGVNLPILLEFVMKRESLDPKGLRNAIEQVSTEDFRWVSQADVIGNLM